MFASLFNAGYFPISVESSLKRFYIPNMRKAFMSAIIAHVVLAGAYMGVRSYQEGNKVYTTRIMTYADLPVPPPVNDAPVIPDVPDVRVQAVIGVPDPVADDQINLDVTLSTQSEMSQAIAPIARDIQSATAPLVSPKEQKVFIQDDALPKPDEFVAFEMPPTPVLQPKPEYPEIARKAGVEGIVIVKALIDKDGRVKDTQLIKGLGAGLDEAAIASVKASIFTPAIQNHRPVAVWMAVPLRFKLR